MDFSLTQSVMDSIEDFTKRMEQAATVPEIEDGVLTVRVVGEFSAGKTRVIREILNDKIPEPFKPISSQEAQTKLQLEISYGEEEQLLLIEKSEDSDQAKILATLDKFPSREEVSQYDPDTHRLRLLINEPQFILANGDGYYEDDKPKKLFLIDTPGWNSGQDDFAEQDAHQYFVGEHNLAIIYVCHANRLDGEINKNRLNNFLEALGDALFLQNKAHLQLVITHCEKDSQQRLKEKMQQRILSLWQALEFDIDDLDLTITALDFHGMAENQLQQFRQQFWSDLLQPVGTEKFEFHKSYATQILEWQKDWDIRPMLLQHIAVFRQIETYIQRLYIDGQFIQNMNMTRLMGLNSEEIQNSLMQRWCRQLEISNINRMLYDLNIRNKKLPKEHPLSQWWDKYWIVQINTLSDLFVDFVKAMQKTIAKVEPKTSDLQVFLSNQMMKSYQKLIDHQQQSFNLLVDVVEENMQDLALDKFVATLLKLSVLQNRYQYHYQQQKGDHHAK